MVKTKTKLKRKIENENESENAKTAKLVTASIQYGAYGCYGRTALNP